MTEQGNQCVKPEQSCYREGETGEQNPFFDPEPENLPSFAALRRFIVNPQRMEHDEPLEVFDLARAA